jgi:hypothetical protein
MSFLWTRNVFSLKAENVWALWEAWPSSAAREQCLPFNRLILSQYRCDLISSEQYSGKKHIKNLVGANLVGR